MRSTLLFASVFTLASVNWTALLDQSGGTNVKFGVALNGPSPYVRNEAQGFAPASTAKLFTAATALAVLGPDFRYRTRLEWDQAGDVATNLRLTGNGDPTWGMAEFQDSFRARFTAMAKALKAAGVKSIQGEIQVSHEDPRWDYVEIPAGWKSTDPESCGGTLAQGFNLDINCSTLKVTAASHSWASGADTPVELRMSEGSSTRLKASLNFIEPGKIGYVITGTLKKGASASFSLPVWGTRGWMKSLLAYALKQEGLSSTNAQPITGVVPRSYEYLSPPLSYILKPFLKNSVNFLGDAILKTIAVYDHRPEPSLLAGGLASVHAYLQRAGLPAEFQLNDGAGLSRTSLVTPRAMRAFLEFVRNEPYFPALWQALPIAAVDGTLKNRMKGTAAASRLRGKTGTLDGVYNLAGFVPGAEGYVPYVMLTKTSISQSATARRAEDRVGAKLASIVPRPREEEVIEPYPIYIPEHGGPDQR